MNLETEPPHPEPTFLGPGEMCSILYDRAREVSFGVVIPHQRDTQAWAAALHDYEGDGYGESAQLTAAGVAHRVVRAEDDPDVAEYCAAVDRRVDWLMERQKEAENGSGE